MRHRHPLIVPHQLAHRRKHFFVATLICGHRGQGSQGGVPQPRLLVLQIGQQNVDQGHDLIHRSTGNELDRSVLDEPGFLRIAHRLHRKFVDLRRHRIIARHKRSEHGPANPWVLVLHALHHQLRTQFSASGFTTKVTTADPQRLVGGEVPDVEIMVVHVFADLFVARLLRAVEATEEMHAGIVGEGFPREIVILSVLARHRSPQDESIVRLGAPGTFRQLVGLGVLGRRCAGDAQGLARDGVGQREGHAPLFLVIAAPTKDAERSVVAARQIVVPLPVVHELPVVLGLLLVEEAHGGAAPDLANPAAGVAVQHEGGGVETLDRADVAGPSIDRVLSVRDERGRRGHGDREFTVLAVVDKTGERAIVTVGIITSAGVTIEMSQRSLQSAIGHVCAALLGQQ